MYLCQFTFATHTEKSPYQSAHVSESMHTQPRSDSEVEFGGPLFLALTNGDEDKHFGVYLHEVKAELRVLSLPLSTQTFFSCLCAHRQDGS